MKDQTILQQDEVPLHFATAVCEYSNEAVYFFLWSQIKVKIYTTQPLALKELSI